jgi:predicted translin family RNA/ssDNA-binding protein
VRGRFVDLVERQLDLFEQEYAGLIRDCEAALRAYDRARRDEAEERYGDYVDLVDSGRESLVEYRDAYAQTLEEEAAEEYEEVFNSLVRKRLPRFGLELDT